MTRRRVYGVGMVSLAMLGVPALPPTPNGLSLILAALGIAGVRLLVTARP